MNAEGTVRPSAQRGSDPESHEAARRNTIALTIIVCFAAIAGAFSFADWWTEIDRKLERAGWPPARIETIRRDPGLRREVDRAVNLCLAASTRGNEEPCATVFLLNRKLVIVEREELYARLLDATRADGGN